MYLYTIINTYEFCIEMKIYYYYDYYYNVLKLLWFASVPTEIPAFFNHLPIL